MHFFACYTYFSTPIFPFSRWVLYSHSWEHHDCDAQETSPLFWCQQLGGWNHYYDLLREGTQAFAWCVVDTTFQKKLSSNFIPTFFAPFVRHFVALVFDNLRKKDAYCLLISKAGKRAVSFTNNSLMSKIRSVILSEYQLHCSKAFAGIWNLTQVWLGDCLSRFKILTLSLRP